MKALVQPNPQSIHQVPLTTIFRGSLRATADNLMHNCLRNAELFDRVCRWVLVSKPNECPIITGKSALAALCRTCHLFQEPALNVLYKSLESLHPLLSCLPTTTIISEGKETIVSIHSQRYSKYVEDIFM